MPAPRAWVVAAVLLAAPAAHAQPAPPPEAQTLFETATTEMKAGQFAAACPRLERVVELVPEGVGAKIALGDCYVGLGKLATAHRAYVAAELAASAAMSAARVKDARAKAEALLPKLARITLELAPEVKALPGLSITRDGAPIAVAEVGLPVAVDAGEHVYVVSATDRTPNEQRITIKDGEKIPARFTGLAPLVSGPAEAPPPVAPPPPPPKDGAGGFWSAQRYAGLGVGIGGALGIVLGGAFAGVAKSKLDESNESGGCDPDTNVCASQRGVDLRSEALTLAHAGTGGFVAGGVLLATGVLVFALAPSEGTSVSVGPTGFAVGGRF